jgi:hypothetical protein
MSALKLTAIIAGVVSAICWFSSAVVNVGGPGFYWDEGPAWRKRNLIIAKYLNSAAALTSGISVLIQALP